MLVVVLGLVRLCCWLWTPLVPLVVVCSVFSGVLVCLTRGLLCGPGVGAGFRPVVGFCSVLIVGLSGILRGGVFFFFVRLTVLHGSCRGSAAAVVWGVWSRSSCMVVLCVGVVPGMSSVSGCRKEMGLLSISVLRDWISSMVPVGVKRVVGEGRRGGGEGVRGGGGGDCVSPPVVVGVRSFASSSIVFVMLSVPAVNRLPNFLRAQPLAI